MASSKFPVDFVRQIEGLLADESSAFFEAIANTPTVSIRLHPKRAYPKPDSSTKVLWTHNAYYLQERPNFTHDPNFHGGAYYVQDASSMLTEHILTQVLPHPNEDTRVLDLCAAPGGKSTILLSHLDGRGLLIANEVIQARSKILEENLIKWGYANWIVTQSDSAYFVKEKVKFDVVLVDAPCSGEGLFRKDPKAIQAWSLKHVNHCALRQERILDNAAQLVEAGGHLIYSTCTYNQQENGDQIQRLLSSGEWENIEIPLAESWGIVKSTGDVLGYHCYPHKARGEGFFFAVLRKIGSRAKVSSKKNKKKTSSPFQKISDTEWKSMAPFVEDANPSHYYIDKQGAIYYLPNLEKHPSLYNLWHVSRGTQIGECIKGKLKPAHALAQSLLYADNAPTIALTLDQALLYLKGQMPPLPISDLGWNIVTYDSIALGWIKAITPNRYNNYYPKSLRIRKRL